MEMGKNIVVCLSEAQKAVELKWPPIPERPHITWSKSSLDKIF